MRPSAKLVSLATAVPPNVLSQSDVATAANQCFGGRYDEFERLARVFKSPGRRCHVNSDVTGGHVDRLHDVALRQLQAPSVSACDHRACGVGILSLPAEPSPCRGDAARARHCRLLRDGAAVGDEVRARLCPPPQAQESEPPRYLATSTRSSSPSAANSIGCGERSIRTDISSMKSSRRDATPRQQSAC